MDIYWKAYLVLTLFFTFNAVVDNINEKRQLKLKQKVRVAELIAWTIVHAIFWSIFLARRIWIALKKII